MTKGGVCLILPTGNTSLWNRKRETTEKDAEGQCGEIIVYGCTSTVTLIVLELSFAFSCLPFLLYNNAFIYLVALFTVSAIFTSPSPT